MGFQTPLRLFATALSGILALSLPPVLAQVSTPPTIDPPPVRDDRPGAPTTWGDGEPPYGSNVYFATADGCQPCHGGSATALALRDSLGRDVSPWTLWRPGAHANAARDPFFRAQAALESRSVTDPEGRARLEAGCVRCHAPMSYHRARLDQTPLPSLAAAVSDPLGLDGVSCTVCHAATPEGWEDDRFLEGQLPLDQSRNLYGPHRAPSSGPMEEYSGFTPRYGPQLRQSALCGSCHTQRVGPHELLVSSSYLEWRATDATRRQECGQCHFQPRSDRRIARSPLGRDFNLARRQGVGSHGSVGGNAYLLDLLRENADELEVESPLDDLRRAATAARLNLLDRTAELQISEIRRNGSVLLFDVRIENRTGHKLPTGYPSRRVWLMVEVRVGGQEVFATGRFDERGRLVELSERSFQPHRRVVREPSEVPIYEAVPADSAGTTTTNLALASQFLKDNRILPPAWSEGGADGLATAPIGVGGDESFRAGGDTVRFELEVLDGTRGKAAVIARLFYQSMPPLWIRAHAEAESIASKRFTRLTDQNPPLPEILGMQVRFE